APASIPGRFRDPAGGAPATSVGWNVATIPVRRAVSARHSRRKAANQCSPLLGPDVKVTTHGDDAASHGGGHGTNRSDGRDRRDGPTHVHVHAHAHAHVRL